MKNKKAVTLVELIVGISLSMILMVSIGIFTSSGLSNLFLQEKSIGNIFSINQFFEETKKTIDNLEAESEILANGVIFKRKVEYDNGGFSYIGTLEKDFCENGSKTKHIFIKNFIPKSEVLSPFSIKENQVFENNILIAGNKFFGKDFEEGNLGSEILLNSPSSVTKDLEGNIFISDTLNNRILMKNKSDEKFYKFLGEESLKEPISIKFENGNLKVANAGNKEILEYKNLEEKNFSKNFSKEIENKKFEKIKINFYKNFGKKYSFLKISDDEKILDNFSLDLEKIRNYFSGKNFDIEEINENFYKVLIKTEENGNPKSRIIEILKSDFENKNFQNLIDSEKYFKKENNEIFKEIEILASKKSIYIIPKDFSKFYDLGNEDSEEINNISSFEKLTLNGKNIFIEKNNENQRFFLEKEIDKFDNEGNLTGKEKKYFLLPDFKININENFNLENLFSFGNLKGIFSTNFEILEQGKEIFKSKEENFYKNDIFQFKTIKTGNYPYDFGKDFDLKNPGNFIHFDENTDKILDLPIKDLQISKDSGFLNIIIKYYKNFDCENTDINEQKISTIFLKKKIN